MKRPPGQQLTLTKIDAAERQIKAAVKMFFEGKDLVPIYTIANAVREIVASIGKHLEIETVQAELAKARGKTIGEMTRDLIKAANFLKHADRDPAAKITLEENDVEVVLYLACHDFGRVTGGMPTEVQVFEACVFAATTKTHFGFAVPSAKAGAKYHRRLPRSWKCDQSGRAKKNRP